MPWTSLAWFVNLFYFLYISDKTESRSLNIKLSFMFGSIKSPVQHSISSSQSFNIYCTPSVLSRADARLLSKNTNFSEHLQAPALLYMPLSTLMSNNLMSRCFMCYALCANFLKNVKNDFPLCDMSTAPTKWTLQQYNLNTLILQ